MRKTADEQKRKGLADFVRRSGQERLDNDNYEYNYTELKEPPEDKGISDYVEEPDRRTYEEKHGYDPAKMRANINQLGQEIKGAAKAAAGLPKAAVEKVARAHGDFKDWEREQSFNWDGVSHAKARLDEEEAAAAVKRAMAAKQPKTIAEKMEKESGIGKHGHTVGRPRGRGRPRGSVNMAATPVPQGRSGYGQYNQGAPLYQGQYGGSLGDTGSALSGTLSFVRRPQEPQQQEPQQGYYDESQPVIRRPSPRFDPYIGFPIGSGPREEDISFPIAGRQIGGGLIDDPTLGLMPRVRGQQQDSGLGLMPRNTMPMDGGLGLMPRTRGAIDPGLGLVHDRRVDNGNGPARQDDLFGLSLRRPPAVGIDVSGLLWGNRRNGNGNNNGKKSKKARR